MNQIKISHLADVHFRPDKKEEALSSLRTAIEKGREERVNLFAIAGDLFHYALKNAASGGLPELQRAIQQMMNVAPVVAVKGTPTHDIDGCYEVLQETQAKHGFTVLDPQCAYLLCQKAVYKMRKDMPVLPDFPYELLILGCSEPSKEWFLKDKRMGRDEANAAIIDGMRNLLLGMGVRRRKHPEIPCLFVYHGLVEGAIMCNEQVIRPGEITIGRDDLALVGADYCALGHIHLAQQIGDMSAYYGGSAYPVNWGEMDQKGFNLVWIVDTTQIEGPAKFYPGQFNASVDRVPFPHPPRKKIVTDWVSADEPLGEDEFDNPVAGYQVWQVYRVAKEKAAQIDTTAILDKMLAWGALPGSRVTTDIIPIETVRAGEIQSARSLVEKLVVYAENSGQKIPGDVIEKAMQLEAEAIAAGEIGEGLHIVLDKLGLRGATGIRKGLGLVEAWIDFSQYDPGVIAVVGANGTGKTTLFRNLQPFPDMADKAGILQDHFDLADSWRDLYFTDEKTGSQYRAFIQIDGATPTGKCAYYLYRDGQPLLSDDRLASYAAKVVELYGSKELFLRSAYVAQKTTKKYPALSEATKGEKKAIFRELGGLDYVQAYADSAKENHNTLEKSILRDQGRTETLETLVGALPEKRFEMAAVDDNLRIAKEILEQRDAAGRQAKEAKDKLETELGEQRITEQKIESNREQADKLSSEGHWCAEVNLGLAKAIEGKPEAEKQIAEYESLKAQEAKLNDEKTGILEQRERILAEYHDAESFALAAVQKIDSKKAEKMQERATFSTKKATLLANIANLIEKTEKPIDENCPHCGQIMPEGMLDKDKDEREWQIGQLKERQSEEFEVEKEIADCEKYMAVCDLQKGAVAKPEEPELPELDEEGLDAIKASINNDAMFDIDTAREMLAQAQEAAVKIAENEKRVTQLTTEIVVLESEILELKMKIDPELEIKHRDACSTYENCKADYIEAREQVKGLEVEQKNLQDQIAELEKQSEELHEIRQEIKKKQRDIVDWSYLMRACGPDGIQALELDAMGPGIAEIVNGSQQHRGLLKVVCEHNPWTETTRMGNPFDRIKFETTRIGGAGSKRRQIEDFLIFAHDMRDDTWTEISNISGGESVWVIRAIYDAFGIVRDRNTGQRFLTPFQDEADGALDPDARLAYFRMLEVGHEESDRRHTLVITHSQDAQEMIAQKIEMTELGEATT